MLTSHLLCNINLDHFQQTWPISIYKQNIDNFQKNNQNSPNWLWHNSKLTLYSLVDALVLLFRKFLEDGQLPELMKLAFVIPVHKGGSGWILANFRPVSLASHIMKTSVNHLEVNKKLNPNQHGFRSRRSCLSQLLHYDHILSILEEGNNVESIHLEFSKAFDKVDIGILCHKLT